MKRLKIPQPLLKGTPLTVEEQKQILGGLMDATRKCTCYFTYNASCSDPLNCPSIKEVVAKSEDICSEKCNYKCDSHPSCIATRYHYSAFE